MTGAQKQENSGRKNRDFTEVSSIVIPIVKVFLKRETKRAGFLLSPPTYLSLVFFGKHDKLFTMKEYAEFSRVYDRFMDEIPYGTWCSHITQLLKNEGIDEGLLCELGCGTGTMTELLALNGYDMTGIDVSSDMLQEALKKRDQSGLPILYLQQDMREFELYGTMRAFISVCDSMNYLLTKEDLITTFKLVNNYLDPGGVFIFDLKTAYYFREILGDRTEVLEDEDAFCVWENTFDEEEKINEYALTIFERTDSPREDLYERFEEFHEQRAYEIEEITKWARDAGMIPERFLDADTMDEVRDTSERIYVILREQGKRKI